MKNITIITDTWEPQINGVVTTLKRIEQTINNTGKAFVHVIHPDLFFAVKCPTYAEMRLAMFSSKKITTALEGSDCIHIATEGPLGFAARKVCKKQGWRYTTAFHTKLPEYINLRCGVLSVDFLYKMVQKFHRRSEAVLVPTQSVYDELKERGFKKLVLWSRGVDTDVFRPYPVDTPYERPVHLYVGRVSVEKNLTKFLELPLNGSKVIVGDGPDLPLLRSKYSDAHFVGYKTGTDLVNAYNAADVFVFPSISDTFGLVMLEANACGLPVAGYPVTGPKDVVVNGVNGWTDWDLDKAIRKAKKVTRDSCEAFAKQHSWQRCVDQFMNVLVKKEKRHDSGRA